jgi:hypothetical protein
MDNGEHEILKYLCYSLLVQLRAKTVDGKDRSTAEEILSVFCGRSTLAEASRTSSFRHRGVRNHRDETMAPGLSHGLIRADNLPHTSRC